METFLLWSVLCAAVVLFFDYCRLEWWEKGVDQVYRKSRKRKAFFGTQKQAKIRQDDLIKRDEE